MKKDWKPSPEHEILTTRVFPVPRETAYRAWAEPQWLAKWWGPKGFSNDFRMFDFKVGGEWEFDMIGPDGKRYHNKSVFAQIVPNERIVFDHVVGHLFRVVAVFATEGAGTRVSFHMQFDGAAERDRIATFAKDANEENFDRLGVVLGEM